MLWPSSCCEPCCVAICRFKLGDRALKSSGERMVTWRVLSNSKGCSDAPRRRISSIRRGARHGQSHGLELLARTRALLKRQAKLVDPRLFVVCLACFSRCAG